MPLSPYEETFCETFLRQVCKNVFTGNTFRSTLFVGEEPDTIVPRFRLSPGSIDVERIDRPELTFKRGMPVAGIALDGAWVVLVLPPFKDESAALTFFRDALRLPPSLAEHLSSSQFLRRVRQILCAPVPFAVPLVLSVDSLDADGLGSPIDGEKFQLKHAQQLQKEMRSLADVAFEHRPKKSST